MADLDLRLRPRFQLDVACRAETLVGTLGERIAGAEPALEGFCDLQHCVLRIAPARRAFFSPELDITFEPIESGAPGVRVRCLFGPRPAVFTGFAFAYAILAAVGLGGALLALAQLTLGALPWGFAATAVSMAGIGTVYAASFIGQGLAAEQMYEIRRFLDGCIEAAEQRARREPRTSLDSARL